LRRERKEMETRLNNREGKVGVTLTKNDQVVIDLKEEYERRNYICLYFRRYLAKMSAKEYYCNKCNIPFWTIRQQVREKQKLTTPKGLNTETLIATVPDDPNAATSSTNLGRPLKVRGALKALQNKGIKIKNYKETDEQVEQ
jgi:hypothetical protein